MTMIFVSHSSSDETCAEQIRTSLESRGYHTWRKAESLSLESVLYPHTIEQVILSSATLVLLWSNTAAQSEWVERHILFAQQLKKLIVPVLLDSTVLPTTLVTVSPIANQGSCADVMTQLAPLLPLVNNTDALIALAERAAHDLIRERKAAIEQAEVMLQRGEQHEAVLAILDYLARYDLIDGVRQKAKEVLDADAEEVGSAPQLSHPSDSRHVFGARCKNGHVSYFDKRFVCKAADRVVRGLVYRAGKELDELHLPCDTCGIDVVARVDCEGYK